MGGKQNKTTMKSKKKTTTTVRGELPIHHLIPYGMAVVASFVWFLPRDPTPATAVLKCLPILYLIAYIGFTERLKGEPGKVLLALIFSVVGDAFMAFPDEWLMQGVQAFAIAQILYIVAFGFKRIRLPLGIFLYGIGFTLLYFILPYLPPPLRVVIPAYCLLIGTMFWRALDRYHFWTHLCKRQRLCSVIGATSFITSDTAIVFLQLFQLIPHIPAQVIILSTYYLAQVLLMLGSADNFWATARVSKKTN